MVAYMACVLDTVRDPPPKKKKNLNKGLFVKDGVLSAFEHHCAGSYNLPFAGFLLI
jgi:hypothetical protein